MRKKKLSFVLIAGILCSVLPQHTYSAAKTEKSDVILEYYNIDFDQKNDTKNTFVNKAYSGRGFGYWSKGSTPDPVEVRQSLEERSPPTGDMALTITNPGTGGCYTVGNSSTLPENEYLDCVTWYELSFKFDNAVTSMHMEGAGYIFQINSDGELWLGGLKNNVFSGSKAIDVTILPDTWYTLVIAADNVNKYNGCETRFYAWLNNRPLETSVTPISGCANTINSSYAKKYEVQRHVIWYATPENILSKLWLDDIRIFTSGSAVKDSGFDGVGSAFDSFKSLFDGNILIYDKSCRASVDGKIVQIDPNNENIKPIIKDGAAFIPCDFLASALGKAHIVSDDSVIIKDGATSVALQNGSESFYVNNKYQKLSAAPFSRHGVLYVPMKDLCEAFGIPFSQNENGIFISGNMANLSWSDKDDYRTLSKALRDVIYEPTPSAEEIISALRRNNPDGQHPRLLINSQSVDKLKAKISSGVCRSYMNTVINYADCYLVSPRIENNNSLLLYTARDALKRVENLGFAYLMTGRSEYADAAIDVIMTVCSDEFPNWNPQHFLAVSEMSAAVALGYDWCYDRLTAEQKTFIQNALIQKSFLPVMEDYNNAHRLRPFNWSCWDSFAYPNNWVAVCAAGTSMAALAVGDEDLGSFADAGSIVSEGIDRLKDLQDSYMPDGGMVDGTSYWRYATTYMVSLIASLESALSTDYTIMNAPGINLTFDWMMQMLGPAGLYNFDSNDAVFIDSPEFRWFALKSGNSKYAKLRDEHIAEHNIIPSYRDILWYDSDSDGGNIFYNRNYVCRGAVNTVSLSGGANRSDSWISMFCHFMNKSVNSMQDFDGSFILDMLGERWALDLGSESGMYSTSEIPRWEYYRARAEGHNTVLVDPNEGFDHNPAAYSVQKCFKSNDASAMTIYDFTQQLAFRGVTSWLRGIYLDKQTQCVTVQDEISVSDRAPYYWFMHTDADITLSDNRRTALLTKNGKQIRAYLVSEDTSIAFEIMDAEPLPTSPHPNQDSNDGVRKLTVHKSDAAKINMAVRFVPVTGIKPNESAYLPLQSWELLSIPETQRLVTVNNSYADSAGGKFYTPGSIVSIHAGERDGYTFSGWSTDDVFLFNASSTKVCFEMPDKNVDITANWTKNTGLGVCSEYYDIDFDNPVDTDTAWTNKAISDLSFQYLPSLSLPSLAEINPFLLKPSDKGNNCAVFTHSGTGGYYVVGNPEYWKPEQYINKVTWYELTFKFEDTVKNMYMEGVGFPFEITEDGELWIGGLSGANVIHGDRALNASILPDRWYRLVIAADNINKYNDTETMYYAWLNGKPILTSTFSAVGCADVTPAYIPDATDTERQILLVSNSAPAKGRLLLDDIKIYTSENAVAAYPKAGESSRFCDYSYSQNGSEVTCTLIYSGEPDAGYIFVNAVYETNRNGNNVLKSVAASPAAVGADGLLSQTCAVTAVSGNIVKSFLWSPETLSPCAPNGVYIVPAGGK